MITKVPFKINFIHTQAPKIDDLDNAPKEEKQTYKMHQQALLYYHSNDCNKPNYHPILFPAQK